MGRRMASILFAILAAVAGAFAGQYVARMRRQAPEGQAEAAERAGPRSQPPLRPRDVIPGLIAALRVHDRPWSYLHIPAWLAAFVVNFALGAMERDFRPLVAALRGEDAGWGWRRPAERWTEARVVSEPGEATQAYTQ